MNEEQMKKNARILPEKGNIHYPVHESQSTTQTVKASALLYRL